MDTAKFISEISPARRALRIHPQNHDCSVKGEGGCAWGILVDIGTTGARVKFKNDSAHVGMQENSHVMLQPEFGRNYYGHRALEARVTWVKGNEAGLEFFQLFDVCMKDLQKDLRGNAQKIGVEKEASRAR